MCTLWIGVLQLKCKCKQNWLLTLLTGAAYSDIAVVVFVADLCCLVVIEPCCCRLKLFTQLT